MTLGGLALAVGILVDDGTVALENVNWHLEQGKPLQQAIMDGARQIVVPAFVTLVCICIVFAPLFQLAGLLSANIESATIRADCANRSARV
jgi:multidrug efflux pump subunit AcrB